MVFLRPLVVSGAHRQAELLSGAGEEASLSSRPVGRCARLRGKGSALQMVDWDSDGALHMGLELGVLKEHK